MSFTMRDFIKEDIAVSFKDEIEQKEFLEECQKFGIDWGDMAATDFVPAEFEDPDGLVLIYMFDMETLIYDEEDLFKDRGYEIVPFSEFKFYKFEK